MRKNRLDIQTFLENFMGNKRILEGYQNVYLDPPESINMNYPCIVYKLSDIDVTYADNKSYRKFNRYQLIYITEDPDDPNIYKIMDFEMCSFDRSYNSDNLHHFSYDIFYRRK